MKINPWIRMAVTAGAVLVVALAAGTYRMLDSHGAFTHVTPGFNGTCETVRGVVGPEDIAIDRQAKLAFVSAMDRAARAKGKSAPQDGLYSYDYLQPGAHLVKLAGTPADFHPHGISLYRAPDGSLTLMAINHRMSGSNTVDIFSVTVAGGVAKLAEVGSIGSGMLISPNAVAAVDQDRFYVVNDHTSKTKLGRWLDDNLVLPRADVLYFDGVKFAEVVTGLNFPNGAALSPDGKYLYVTEAYPRTLLTFERNPFFGQLKQVNALSIPSNLDNARVAADGSLWLGSHPDSFKMDAFRSDPSKPAPSEIFRVSVANGIPQSATPVYVNMGSQIGGSSVGAVADGHLLIGSPIDTKILNCKLP
ncbi:MAG: SMP-30/gluconolactonase/LRE family protein [Alphaproteobacteria bacterium]|nr:SMP-30/gluconolactonase/LRE family protein [Alphaproteobacteria bacterium]